jgi:hypothetical protein
MDHVAMIDFRGFVGLTKDLGRVTVRNRIALSSHGFTLGKRRYPAGGDAAM